MSWPARPIPMDLVRNGPAYDRLIRSTRFPDDLFGGECWEWVRGKNAGGYGNLYITDARGWPAHRVAYELWVGPIPEGLQLDHLCRNRACVNPLHLEPVTPSENIIRGSQVRDDRFERCKNGHEYAGTDNLRILPKGHVICRQCGRDRARQHRERQKRVAS